MGYAFLALLIIVVIGQMVIAWKASPNWRWYQITPVIIATILAATLVFPTASALKSRSAWHKVKEDLEDRIEKVRAEQLQLRHGDPSNPLAEDGVVPMSLKVAKLGIEAGRRWRGLRLTNASFGANTAITLSEPPQDNIAGLPVEDAADGDAEPAAPQPLIPTGFVIYAFGEGKIPNVDEMVPTFYLGEYKVTNSSPNQITLVPTAPLLPAQRQAIESRNASSWSIYEMLPLDGHEPFIAEGSKPNDDNVFGRIDDQMVKGLLGNRVTPNTLQSYLRDGGRSQQDDAPLTRWVKIEFTKRHSIVVDSPDQRGALDGGFFDGSGRAVDSRLQQGNDGNVKFEVGEQITVQGDAADQLIDEEGVARLVDEYYLRQLNDYRFVLRRIRLRIAELQIRTRELQEENGVLQTALDSTVRMLNDYQDQKLRLEQDFEQTEKERLALESYNKGLQDSVRATKETLINLYRSNQGLEQQLEAIHSSISGQGDSFTTVQ